MAKSYYDILGVKRSATADEIKKAFRKLARKHHPDAGGDEETFKQLNEAYEVLSDTQKKKDYDLYGQYMNNAAGSGQQSGGNPFANYGGTNPFAGYSGGNRYEQTSPNGWSEILDSIRNGEGVFGSGWDVPKRSKKGQDIQVDLEISFEDAFNGAVRKVSMHIPSTGEKQSLDVKIPQGAVDGGKLRYRGRGEYGSGKGERGDLVITTKIKPHALYKRKGADVIFDFPLSIAEAALGAQVLVPAPDGTAVKLRIPAGTQNEKLFRIKDKGAKKVKGEGYGSLDVIVHIVVPTELNEDQKAALEAFKQADTTSVRPDVDARMARGRSGAKAVE